MSSGKSILPIWHNIDRDYITQKSPILADRKAAKTSEGLDQVIQGILEVVEPEQAQIIRGGLIISVIPRSVRLHTGEWSVRTPITVSNRNEIPLYDVQLEIMINGEGVISDSVGIDPGRMTTNLQGQSGGFVFFSDFIRMDMVSPQGKEFILLTIHTLGVKQSREIIWWGTTPNSSTADIKIVSFETNPSPLLQR